MRSINLYLIIVFLFFCNCANRLKVKNTEFNGDIKAVKETIYAAMKVGNEIKKDSIRRSSYTIYNDEGYMTEGIYYHSNGSIERKSTIKYNKKGKLVESRDYNADAKLISKWILNYDNTGSLMEVLSYNPDGKMQTKSIYKNDSKGNIVEQINYDSNNDLVSSYQFKYDSLGKQVQENEFHVSENETWQHFTKYDQYNNPVEVISADEVGMIFTNTKYIYTYDSTNNWIKRIQIDDELPIFIVERELEFYK